MTLKAKLKKRAEELASISPGDTKFEEIVTLNQKEGDTCICTKDITLARVVNLLEKGWIALPF